MLLMNSTEPLTTGDRNLTATQCGTTVERKDQNLKVCFLTFYKLLVSHLMF